MRAEKIFYERLDKVFDTHSQNNIEIDNNLFKRYAKFNRNRLYWVEKIIETINKKGGIYAQIDGEVIPIRIKQISFDSTVQFYKTVVDLVDIYKIEYENGFVESISAIELFEMVKNGGIKKEKGFIGINKNQMRDLIYREEFWDNLK